jgi:hypothetical protein
MDAEKATEKVQHPFMIKGLKKQEIEEWYLNIIKTTHNKPVVNVTLKEKNRAFPLKSEMRQKYPLSILLFNIVF